MENRSDLVKDGLVDPFINENEHHQSSNDVITSQTTLLNDLNFRDVGKHLSDLDGINKGIKSNLLFRSGDINSLDTLTFQRILIENDINTIIDLRSDYERVETPLQDTGDVEIDRYTIDLTGGSFKIALFNKLTFVKKCSILVTKLVRNDDEEARRIICKDVLANMTLSELAAITLTKSTSGIAQIFKIISEKSGKGGILIHCTQGKDRTDYMITNHYLNTDRWIINNELVKDEEPPRALKAMVTNGLPLQVFAKCENGWVDNVADELLRLTGLERANNSDIKVEDWREDHVKSAIDLYLQQYCDISIEVITSVRDHLQSV